MIEAPNNSFGIAPPGKLVMFISSESIWNVFTSEVCWNNNPVASISNENTSIVEEPDKLPMALLPVRHPDKPLESNGGVDTVLS